MMTQQVTQPIDFSKEEQEFSLLQRQACALFSSGLFPDLKSKAQAITKVMAGKELGLPAFASITGIHVVAGKTIIGANLIATMIANNPKYSYRISKATKEICEINFFENDKSVGSSSFTIQEAQEASLLGKDNWKKYPSDMLFARAISRGAKRYAPGIFGGTAVYTPDELNIEHDEDGVVTSPMPGLTTVGKLPNIIQPEEINGTNDEFLIDEFK